MNMKEYHCSRSHPQSSAWTRITRLAKRWLGNMCILILLSTISSPTIWAHRALATEHPLAFDKLFAQATQTLLVKQHRTFCTEFAATVVESALHAL